ncbi:MAG: PD-(D/E)XK nuclease family protein [Puniceicoccales bacterium]|jgi:hypothetical protein|nr:PD-(D/E)XK nuclease family protein [Puniceicoccales bacterium]
MATHVTDSIQNLIREGAFAGRETQTTFVAKSRCDIWHLKSVLLKCGVGTAAMRFLTADELRRELMAAFDVREEICTAEMLNLIFDEVAGKTRADDPLIRALVAGKNSTLRAFHEILSSGARIDGILPQAMLSFLDGIRREISNGGLALEPDCDRLLLELCDVKNITLEGRVIFHGFLPCDGNKVLMEVATKCFADADAVICDFGDAEFVHLWMGTLEKIFGECELNVYSDDQKAKSVETVFKVYESAVDEVCGTFGEILKILEEDSSASVCVCFGSNQSVHLPMLLDKLEEAGIAHCDHIGRTAARRSHEIAITLWAEWQTKRDCQNFCRFCAELLANCSMENTEFERIMGDVTLLQGKCLSDNYDVLLEFANLKNVHSFDAVEKYDIHGEKFFLGNFCKKFTAAFEDILPANVLDALKEQGKCCHSGKVFSRKNLVRYFAEFATFDGRSFAQSTGGNVTLLAANEAIGRSFSHIFAVGMDAKNFDNFGANSWLCDGTIEKINGGTLCEDCGGTTIRSSCNYLLSSAGRKYLQIAAFNDFARQGNLVLSFAKKDHCNGGTAQLPAKIFSAMLYEASGKFYSPEVEKQLLDCVDGTTFRRFYRTPSALSADDMKSAVNCAASYSARHNLSLSLHPYCFGVDRKAGVKFSCKSLEYILKNPHVGFYDSVLRLPPMPWQITPTDKRIAVGSLVHEFLQIFEAGSSFVRKIPTEAFIRNVDVRARRLVALMEKACAAADAAVPTDFARTVNHAAILAKRLIARLFLIPNWQSFRSEYILPKDLSVSVCGVELKLSGRLDFLISSGTANGDDQLQSAVTIVDFKTGNDFELTEKNIKWHMQRYASLQLLLYGLALKATGFAHVKILILKPDSPQSNSAISIDYAIDMAQEPMAKLAKTIETGLIERQIFGKTVRSYFAHRLPTATTDLY